MTILDSWTPGEHTWEGTSHPTYRKGSGPGVVVIHEIPGPTPSVVGFGQELVDAGYTVVLPHLFGKAGGAWNGVNVARAMAQVCISSEFTKLATGVTTPIAGWLRSLARDLHAELGGPGVGALGMCFTGGFALAMMVDESVVAPVLCQPSVPFTVGKARSADVNLSPADLEVVRRRAAGGCAVLGIQYASDPLTGTRFDTLDRELGDGFLRVDLPGKGHSVVTEQRSQVAVDAVLDFFGQRLRA